MKLSDWADCSVFEREGVPCPFERRSPGADGPRREWDWVAERRKQKGDKDVEKHEGLSEALSEAVRVALALGFSYAEAVRLAQLSESLRRKGQKVGPGVIPSPVPVGGPSGDRQRGQVMAGVLLAGLVAAYGNAWRALGRPPGRLVAKQAAGFVAKLAARGGRGGARAMFQSSSLWLPDGRAIAPSYKQRAGWQRAQAISGNQHLPEGGGMGPFGSGP